VIEVMFVLLILPFLCYFGSVFVMFLYMFGVLKKKDKKEKKNERT
jgi:hypothetical protein